MGFFSNLWRSVSKPDRVRIAPSPDPPDPMEGIVETLWPFSKDEEILRERIAQLANSEVPSVAWELYALRLNLLRSLLHAEMLDSPAFSTLLDRVNDEARRRLRDVGWPAAVGYGAQFAAGFNSDNVALVSIGGEEAKRALNRLTDLVEGFGGAAGGQGSRTSPMLWKRRECFLGGNDTRVPFGAALDLVDSRATSAGVMSQAGNRPSFDALRSPTRGGSAYANFDEYLEAQTPKNQAIIPRDRSIRSRGPPIGCRIWETPCVVSLLPC